MSNDIEKVVFTCDCMTPTHVVQFMFIDNDEDFMYITVVPGTASFWGRVKLALRYMFTGTSAAWGEVLLTMKDTRKLVVSLQEQLPPVL